MAAVLAAFVAAVALPVLLGRPWAGARLAAAAGIPRPAVIAHRGASFLAPEESRPAFLLARELGADYLEFDVQRTRDGVLVALHDDSLLRTTDVAEVYPDRAHATVDAFTWQELQALDTGSWFNRSFPDRARDSFRGLHVPRLEEILDIAEGASPRPGVYIETKSAHRYPGIERDLVDALTRRGWLGGPGPRGRVVLQSFEPESLARLKELAPDVPRLLLVDEAMAAHRGWDGLLDEAARVGGGLGTWGSRWAAGPDWSAQDAPDRYVATWPWRTGAAHARGLFVHCWTIDDRWEMDWVRLGGADGIFTNRTELAVDVYRGAHPDLDALWARIGYR